jgi:hypothetical protein
LQRSEQNGRQRDCGVHGTAVPQVGQATARGFAISRSGAFDPPLRAQRDTADWQDSGRHHR